jgi:molybdate transport system ATP-binding protein
MIQVLLRKRWAAGRLGPEFSLDVEFRADAAVTCLFGPAGAGKTLILDLLAGFARPDDGRIHIGGAIVFDGASGISLPPERRQCGYVGIPEGLFPHMTVRNNLLFGAQRRPRLERHRRVKDALERFGLSGFDERRPSGLSLVEQRRCALARAVLSDPRVLLLDAPARGLDAIARRQIWDLVRALQAELKIPVLATTDSLDDAFAAAGTILVLHQGRILQQAAPRQLLDRPASIEVARLLGLHNLLQAEIRALDPAGNTSSLNIQGHPLAGPYFPGRLKGDRVWLYVRPEELTASPRDGLALKPNQLAAPLARTVEHPEFVRLEFASGVSVHMPRRQFDRHGDNKEWVIEFPAQSLRVL